MTGNKITTQLQQNMTHILPCKTFISIGDCPFRNRCMYIHDMRIQNPNAHKTSRAKSKKAETEGDLFYWPSMESDSNIYSVPNDDASMYSIWNYFVDFCQNCKYQQIHNHPYQKQKNQTNEDMNRYTHHKRLPVFLELASTPSNASMMDSTSNVHNVNTPIKYNDSINQFVDEKNKENSKSIRNNSNHHNQHQYHHQHQKYLSTPPRNYSTTSKFYNSPTSVESTPNLEMLPNLSLYN